MVRVLEYLEIAELDGAPRYRCLKCRHVLGSASADYKTLALRFDEPISEGQPPHLAGQSEIFHLRHYACPACAVLFEIDMMPKDEPHYRSITMMQQ